MLVQIGEFIGRISDRLDSLVAASCMVAIAFWFFDYSLEIELAESGVRPEVHAELLALLVGLGAGFAAFALLLSRRERRRMIYDELRRVAELNHQLRNALEIIADAHYIAENETHRRLILETVESMDTNLKQLFPALGVEHRRHAA